MFLKSARVYIVTFIFYFIKIICFLNCRFIQSSKKQTIQRRMYTVKLTPSFNQKFQAYFLYDEFLKIYFGDFRFPTRSIINTPTSLPEIFVQNKSLIVWQGNDYFQQCIFNLKKYVFFFVCVIYV